MPLRKRRLDHALRTPQRGIWIATMAILLAGAAAIWVATSTGERGRMRVLERVEPGDSAQRVVELLGEPARTCPTGSLEHLHPQFPPGWASALRDAAIERLQEETLRRWIYPLDERAPSCAPAPGTTEVGLDQEQRVLWYVPISGRQPLVLPPHITPEALDEPNEETDA